MGWERDPKNPNKHMWVVREVPSGNKSSNSSKKGPLILPSACRSAGSGHQSSILRRPPSGVGVVNSRGPAEMSTSKGKEREVTPPTPTESPEPSEPPKSSKGKREASPDLASLAFEGQKFVPISKRTAGARVVPCWVRQPSNHYHLNKVVILKLTGKGRGTHWTLVKQKQNSGGEFQSILDIDRIIPVVAITWLDWLNSIGKEQWGLSDETCKIWSDLALSAGGVSINKHPNITVVETRKDGNCGYHALEMIMEELPEDERMTIAQMRERISGLVTQLHFDLAKTEYKEEDLPEYLNGTLEKYQIAIREGSVWIDYFGIHNILEKCGLRAFIWSDCGDVKKMKPGVEKERRRFYGIV